MTIAVTAQRDHCELTRVHVNTVERAGRSRTLHRECRRCGHVIQAGERYHYLDHWRAERSFWCRDHIPRPSDMVVSPNKRRLYLAQEALEDAARSWEPSAGTEPILVALECAVAEAHAVALAYPLPRGNGRPDHDSDLEEKALHVEGWAVTLKTLRERLSAEDVVIENLREEVLEVAAKATIYDNWHYAEE